MLRLLDREKCIQITVRLLCLCDNVNDVVRALFQRRIRLDHERVRHTFQPFCHIAVLEYHPVELTFHQSCRNAEIIQRMALLHAFFFIV